MIGDVIVIAILVVVFTLVIRTMIKILFICHGTL